jgi:hypothetical protein
LINLDSRLVQSQTSIATDISNPFIVGHQRLYTLNASVFLMYVNVWQISPISRLIAGKKKETWTALDFYRASRDWSTEVGIGCSFWPWTIRTCLLRPWMKFGRAKCVDAPRASEDASVFSLGLVPWNSSRAFFKNGSKRTVLSRLWFS